MHRAVTRREFVAVLLILAVVPIVGFALATWAVVQSKHDMTRRRHEIHQAVVLLARAYCHEIDVFQSAFLSRTSLRPGEADAIALQLRVPISEALTTLGESPCRKDP